MRAYLDSNGVDALWAKMKTYVANYSSGSSTTSRAVIGSIQMYGGATAPSGWLLCDGSAVSRTTYSALFKVIGTAYGSGDGNTTFNVPNFSGRFPIGHCNTAPSTNSASCSYQGGSNPYPRSSDTTGWFSLGEAGGEDSHVLTTAEMPSHNHNNGNWQVHVSNGGNTGNNQMTSKSGGNLQTNQFPNVGGGEAHNSMPPYLSVNYIIYAG